MAHRARRAGGGAPQSAFGSPGAIGTLRDVKQSVPGNARGLAKLARSLAARSGESQPPLSRPAHRPALVGANERNAKRGLYIILIANLAPSLCAPLQVARIKRYPFRQTESEPAGSLCRPERLQVKRTLSAQGPLAGKGVVQVYDCHSHEVRGRRRTMGRAGFWAHPLRAPRTNSSVACDTLLRD